MPHEKPVSQNRGKGRAHRYPIYLVIKISFEQKMRLRCGKTTINNSCLGFHDDIKSLTLILRKNLFPVNIIEKVVNQYISRAQVRPSDSSRVQQPVSSYYFKLPYAYVGSFTAEAQKRLRKLVKRYCTNIEIKLVFSSFKVSSTFSVKDPLPFDLRSRVVYKFSCAGCMSVTSVKLAVIFQRAFVSI